MFVAEHYILLINYEYSKECIPHSITKERQGKGITTPKHSPFLYRKTYHTFYTTVNSALNSICTNYECTEIYLIFVILYVLNNKISNK